MKFRKYVIAPKYLHMIIVYNVQIVPVSQNPDCGTSAFVLILSYQPSGFRLPDGGAGRIAEADLYKTPASMECKQHIRLETATLWLIIKDPTSNTYGLKFRTSISVEIRSIQSEVRL